MLKLLRGYLLFYLSIIPVSLLPNSVLIPVYHNGPYSVSVHQLAPFTVR